MFEDEYKENFLKKNCKNKEELIIAKYRNSSLSNKNTINKVVEGQIQSIIVIKG